MDYGRECSDFLMLMWSSHNSSNGFSLTFVSRTSWTASICACSVARWLALYLSCCAVCVCSSTDVPRSLSLYLWLPSLPVSLSLSVSLRHSFQICSSTLQACQIYLVARVLLDPTCSLPSDTPSHVHVSLPSLSLIHVFPMLLRCLKHPAHPPWVNKRLQSLLHQEDLSRREGWRCYASNTCCEGNHHLACCLAGRYLKVPMKTYRQQQVSKYNGDMLWHIFRMILLWQSNTSRQFHSPTATPRASLSWAPKTSQMRRQSYAVRTEGRKRTLHDGIQRIGKGKAGCRITWVSSPWSLIVKGNKSK